jgi:hypothetical protein
LLSSATTANKPNSYKPEMAEMYNNMRWCRKPGSEVYQLLYRKEKQGSLMVFSWPVDTVMINSYIIY